MLTSDMRIVRAGPVIYNDIFPVSIRDFRRLIILKCSFQEISEQSDAAEVDGQHQWDVRRSADGRRLNFQPLLHTAGL